jgi:hypothetical protein
MSNEETKGLGLTTICRHTSGGYSSINSRVDISIETTLHDANSG